MSRLNRTVHVSLVVIFICPLALTTCRSRHIGRLTSFSQTTVAPRNQLLGAIGVLFGALAILYALAELVKAF